jgi:tetratricopeptide (TPR) repeat protein
MQGMRRVCRYIALTVMLLLLATSCSAKDGSDYRMNFIYLVAIDCELRGDTKCTAEAYYELYEVTNQEYFLEKSIAYNLVLQNSTPTYEPNSNHNIIPTLKELYKKTKNQKYLDRLIGLYINTNQKIELEALLEENRVYDEILLELYSELKRYKKGEHLALKLYKKSSDPIYLTKAAIYLYELNIRTPKALKSVFKRFEKSIYKLNDPVYYNYYGYILIDHDKDIDKGIRLVKKALEFEPNNSYYLDSLAWGYYKKKECKKAYDILFKLRDEKQKEIQDHLQEVKKCKY